MENISSDVRNTSEQFVLSNDFQFYVQIILLRRVSHNRILCVRTFSLKCNKNYFEQVGNVHGKKHDLLIYPANGVYVFGMIDNSNEPD